MKKQFLEHIQTLQDTITNKLETIDQKSHFQEDSWSRAEGGGGRTRVLQNGAIFEKTGVNTSAVHGVLPKNLQEYFKVKESEFYACGLSIVIHPLHPMIPTVHANWRYFEMQSLQSDKTDQWFGGGLDLTPYYLFEEDAVHFHRVCKAVCDRHNPTFYEKFKKNCDAYFYNAHRGEARGIGGLFFDYCRETESMNLQKWYDFVIDLSSHFLEAYLPIVEKRKNLNYDQSHRDWQEIRRGRYVEFNLVHDKGTLFGLRTQGRIESILMSLPPKVQWAYDHQPKVGSPEHKLVKVLKNPVEWLV